MSCFLVKTVTTGPNFGILLELWYGYGSIPIKIPFLGGWTSINPSYFDVNRRGTRFWHTAIWSIWSFQVGFDMIWPDFFHDLTPRLADAVTYQVPGRVATAWGKPKDWDRWAKIQRWISTALGIPNHETMRVPRVLGQSALVTWRQFVIFCQECAHNYVIPFSSVAEPCSPVQTVWTNWVIPGSRCQCFACLQDLLL